jgi:hypothetical protein
VNSTTSCVIPIQSYAQSHSGNYYEVVLGVIIYLRSAEIRIFDVSARPWMEIGDMNDLEKAEYMFQPEGTRFTINGRPWQVRPAADTCEKQSPNWTEIYFLSS